RLGDDQCRSRRGRGQGGFFRRGLRRGGRRSGRTAGRVGAGGRRGFQGRRGHGRHRRGDVAGRGGFYGGRGAWRGQFHGGQAGLLGGLQVGALGHHAYGRQVVPAQRLQKRRPVDGAVDAAGIDDHGFILEEAAGVRHAAIQRRRQEGQV